jgi:FAD:protein FMN transferase
MGTSDSIQRAQPLLGTFVEIAAAGGAAPDLQKAVDDAFSIVARAHRLMSFHDVGSDVSRLNREGAARAVCVDPWTYQVLEAALELHNRSAGLFEITLAPLLQKRGLLPRCADDRDLTANRVIATDQIELLPDHCVRYRDPHVRIDLGGIAKGFAVDRALEILRQHGVKSGLVNAGGDLAVFGPQPEPVYLRSPKNASRLLCSVEINDAALASSGQVFDLLQTADAGDCAVFDPSTKQPVRAIAGATVCASTCMVADALTKVLMIAGQGAARLLRQYRASALLVLESGNVWITPDWQDAVRFAT